MSTIAPPSDPNRAVILASGGMDSCVVTAMMRSQGYELNLLHTNYGQRTERKELACFQAIAEHVAAARRLVVDIRHLAMIGGSSLTDTNIEVTPAALDLHEVPSSYVPFRNANIIAIAVSWAETIGAGTIAIGAVEEDSSGYPDCRAVFYDALQKVVDLGTRPETSITIVTPVITMSKADIVRTGMEHNAPLHLTWSCYKREDVACGECDSCALRLRGFALAGFTDPLPYAD
ncbi:MAG TPA: 7-cyano-7-deazaguanine synthase QueC [Candidatus Kapabacteria bacterium]|nr:7-cyano-7-deazaguanine synthase QueC [Candidatus Kapabacteria bacterium]